MHHGERQSAIRLPLRLERGQLQREDEREAYAKLLLVMAQTPRGSWRPDSRFGFKESLETLRQSLSRNALTEEEREAVCERLAAEINLALAGLGLDRFCVERLDVQPPPPELTGVQRLQWSEHMFDDLTAVLVLRPVLPELGAAGEA